MPKSNSLANQLKKFYIKYRVHIAASGFVFACLWSAVCVGSGMLWPTFVPVIALVVLCACVALDLE